MARPVYGGWVTMTGHLSLTFKQKYETQTINEFY